MTVVHLMVAHENRQYRTGCGLSMAATPAARSQLSGWSQDVTCPECNARRRDLQS